MYSKGLHVKYNIEEKGLGKNVWYYVKFFVGC